MTVKWSGGNIRKLPWITDGANDKLKEIIDSGEVKTILEFGSGASTVWLSRQPVEVISVESNKEWCSFIEEKFKEDNIKNVTLMHAPLPNHHLCKQFHNQKKTFDLVIVDDGNSGVDCHRATTAIVSHKLIRPGGYLMLDNDERKCYAPVHKELSSWEKTPFSQSGPDYCGWSGFMRGHWQSGGKWITTYWKKPV